MPSRDGKGRVREKSQNDGRGWQQDQERQQQPAKRKGVVVMVAVHPAFEGG